MILSKSYILNKFQFNPFSSKSSVQRFSGFPGRNGVCLSLIGQLGGWYPVKGTDLSISDCHHAKINNRTEFKYFNLCSRYEKTSDSKSVSRFHIALVFILFKRSSFCFVFNYRSIPLSNCKRFG